MLTEFDAAEYLKTPEDHAEFIRAAHEDGDADYVARAEAIAVRAETMHDQPFRKKGTEFLGPDGQGYRLTRDVGRYEIVRSMDFEAFGGAPEAKPFMHMPKWLAKQLFQVISSV